MKRFLIILFLLVWFVQACASVEEGTPEPDLEATIQSLQTQVIQPTTPPGGSIIAGGSKGETTSVLKTALPPGELGTGIAPDVPGAASQFTFLGQLGGSANAVTVQGNYAYLGQGPRLVVLDITQPENPQPVGQSQVLPGLVQGVQVNGNYAYLGVRYSGLHILDISNPASPVLVSSVQPGVPGCGSIALQGQLAYLACNPSGLFIVDVSNPAQPLVVSSDQFSGAILSIAISGNYAYLVDDTQLGLLAVDISDPASPLQSGFFSALDVPGDQGQADSFYSVRLCGSQLCLAAHTAGLVVLDLEDPASPRFAGRYDTQVSSGLAAQANLVYLVDDLEGLHVVDISNPAQPTQVGLMPTAVGGFEFTIQETSERGVFASQGLVWVPDTTRGLVAIDARNPTNPTRIGHYQTPVPNVLQDLVVQGNLAYVIGRFSGFRVVDVSDPANPRELSYDDQRKDLYLQNPTAIQVRGNYAFISDSNYPFHVYDITDPNQPRQVSAVYDQAASDGAFDLALVGDIAYLSGWGLQDAFYPGYGLWLIDVSDPTQSKAVKFIDLPNQRWHMDLEGDYLYLTDGETDPDQPEPLSLRILDIRDPLSPIPASTYPQPAQVPFGYSDIEVQNQVAYLSAMVLGLDIMDLSDPMAPTLLSKIPYAMTQKTLADGDTLFYNGLMSLDIRDPKNPQVAGYAPVYEVWGYAVSGDILYVGTANHGLYFYQAPTP